MCRHTATGSYSGRTGGHGSFLGGINLSNQNYTNRNHPGAKVREVSLPRLLLLTLRRWRLMLLTGLVLAILLAGMKVVREYRNRGVSNVAHEEYLAAMEIYNASVDAYTTAIERFQTKIDAKQKYFNESLLMQIDPHNECVSTASFVVRTPGLENADRVSSEAGEAQSASVVNASNVVHAYIDFITNGISFDEFATELGVSEQSIRELVLITSDQYHFSSVFKVQVRSMDMDLSKRIMDYILKQVGDNADTFRGTLGEYEISVVSRSEENLVDTLLLQQQTELQNSIATLQKNLQTSQTSLKELIKPSEATGASTKTIIKHGIKYGVAGMVGGIFLVILLSAIRILMTGRILTDDEINLVYGLRNILTFPAGINRRERRSAIDRLVERLINNTPDMTTSAAGDVLLARVETMAASGNMRNILLTGTVGETRLRSLTGNLEKRAEKEKSSVSFDFASDLGKKAEDVRRLRSADAVIVVEEVGESAYREVAQVVDLIEASGKPILGTVYL